MRSTDEKRVKSNKNLFSSSPLPLATGRKNVEEQISVHTSNLPGSTALSCLSEQELRVPCYCEENVWRLAYRRTHADTSKEEEDAIHAVHNGEKIREEKDERLVSQNYVVFISNEQRCCPMFAQRASKNPKEACFWDYHVIFIQNIASWKTDGNPADTNMKKYWQRATVFDVDSRLPYACELEAYLEATFPDLNFNTENDRKKYAPLFRVVRAELYLENFYSDRMHMYNNETGKWNAPPPTYDCIMNQKQNPAKENEKGNSSNLADYVSMRYKHTQEDGTKNTPQSVFGEVLSLQLLLSTFKNM